MRNRIKRSIREVFRTNQGALGSYDYNVVITAARRMDHTYPRRLSQSLKSEFVSGKMSGGAAR